MPNLQDDSPKISPSGQARRFSPVTAVFMIVLVDVLGYTIILPLLPFYAEHFGARPMTIGCLFAAFALCQLISGPLLGRLSDQIGRKPLLILSQLGTCLGFLILAFAGNLAWVFAGRILDGLTAGNISLAQAAISDHTVPEERSKAFGKIGIAFGIGFLIGPAISGALAKINFQAPILAGAGLSLLSIVATIVLLPRDHRDQFSRSETGAPRSLAEPAQVKKDAKSMVFDLEPMIRFFKVPSIRRRLIQFFLFIVSFAMYTSGISLFAHRQLKLGGHPFGPSEVAYILAYGGLLGILLQGWVLSRLVKRWGEETLVASGFLLLGGGLGLLGAARGLPLTLLAVTMSSFGHGLLRPILTSLLSQSAGRSEQGTLLGVNQSVQSVAQIVAPLLGGIFLDQDLPVGWAAAAGCFALGGLWLERNVAGKRAQS